MALVLRGSSSESVGSASTPRTPVKSKQSPLLDLFQLSTEMQQREVSADQESSHKKLRSKLGTADSLNKEIEQIRQHEALVEQQRISKREARALQTQLVDPQVRGKGISMSKVMVAPRARDVLTEARATNGCWQAQCCDEIQVHQRNFL